jgi:integrase
MKLAALENGIWHASFEDTSGNRRVISLRTADRGIAETVAAALVELSAPTTGSAAPTVEKVFRDWIVEKQAEVGPATLDFYRQTANDFLEFLDKRASDDIQAISRSDIVAYRGVLSRRLHAKTVNHRIKTLRMVFEFAVRERHIWENPATHVRGIRNNEPRVRRPFTIEEVRKLLAVADPEWGTLIKLGLYTGQRLGDLARLTWANVNLEKGVIELTARKMDKHVVIPMAPPLAEHLRAFKRPNAAPGAPVLPLAFKAVQSCCGRVGTLSNRFAFLMAKAELRPATPHHVLLNRGRDGKRQRNELSFHCLRHTAVTLLKEAGVPQAVTMELIGHDSPEISQHYTHVGIEALKKAAAALPEV